MQGYTPICDLESRQFRPRENPVAANQNKNDIDVCEKEMNLGIRVRATLNGNDLPIKGELRVWLIVVVPSGSGVPGGSLVPRSWSLVPLRLPAGTSSPTANQNSPTGKLSPTEPQSDSEAPSPQRLAKSFPIQKSSQY